MKVLTVPISFQLRRSRRRRGGKRPNPTGLLRHPRLGRAMTTTPLGEGESYRLTDNVLCMCQPAGSLARWPAKEKWPESGHNILVRACWSEEHEKEGLVLCQTRPRFLWFGGVTTFLYGGNFVWSVSLKRFRVRRERPPPWASMLEEMSNTWGLLSVEPASLCVMCHHLREEENKKKLNGKSRVKIVCFFPVANEESLDGTVKQER